MSSFVRTVQRALKRKKFYGGRGSKLGVKNPRLKVGHYRASRG